MGVTIHFEGRLLGDEAYDRLLACLAAFAARLSWETESIAETEVTLHRMRDEQE